jgi:Domain of unknown function (DUF4845)
MKHPASQRGMTMWGMLFVLGVLAFFLFLGFKLFPPYMTDFKVRSALDSLARQSDFATMSKADIGEALSKRFDIDMIDGVDLGNSLSVETRGRLRVVRIKYEAVIPMAFNISALLEFDHQKQVAASE